MIIIILSQIFSSWNGGDMKSVVKIHHMIGVFFNKNNNNPLPPSIPVLMCVRLQKVIGHVNWFNHIKYVQH